MKGFKGFQEIRKAVLSQDNFASKQLHMYGKQVVCSDSTLASSFH